MAKRKKDVQYLLYSGDKPHGDQTILEFFYGDEKPPYDRGSLFRFIGKVLNDKTTDDPDTISAAYALRDLVRGVDVFSQIGMRWRKRRDTDNRVCIDSPAFGAVMAALNNEFPDDGRTQRLHAVNEIAKMFNCSDRLAEQYYDKVKGNAATTLETFKM